MVVLGGGCEWPMMVAQRNDGGGGVRKTPSLFGEIRIAKHKRRLGLY